MIKLIVDGQVHDLDTIRTQAPRRIRSATKGKYLAIAVPLQIDARVLYRSLKLRLVRLRHQYIFEKIYAGCEAPLRRSF